MQCPNCKATLLMADRQGIEIDYCPQCRGGWLDRGELDKLIERSAQAAPAQVASRPASAYREPHEQNDRYHGKRRKKHGLLGELFDF
mgnify:CR=1 FL=1